jgi:hypothetical protein
VSKSKSTTYLAVGMTAVGFVLMVVAWYGAAGFDNPEQQFPYLLSGSLPGLALVLTGLALALVQEIRKVTARLLGKVDELATGGRLAATSTIPTVVPEDETRVVAAGSSFHDSDCALVEGRPDLQPMTASDAMAQGLSPCRICEPGSDVEAA